MLLPILAGSQPFPRNSRPEKPKGCGNAAWFFPVRPAPQARLRHVFFFSRKGGGDLRQSGMNPRPTSRP
jgi:hypothetical protein